MSKLPKNLIIIFLTILIVIISVYIPFLGLLLLILCVGQLYLSSFKKLNVINSTFFSILSISASVSALGFLIDFIFPYANQFQIISFVNAFFVGMFLYVNKYQVSFARFNNIKSSILSVVLSILGFAFLLIPFATYNSAPNLVYFLSSGEDNASHYAMYERNYSEKSTPYFDNKPTGLIESLKIYPQGIHSFSAYVTSTASFGHQFGVGGLLKIYYLIMALCCATLIFILSEMTASLIKGRIRYIASALVAVSLFIGLILFLAGWGFLTQIVALIYLISILYLVLLNKSNVTTRNSKILVESILLGLLVIGIIFSWYLLLPVALLSLLTVVLKVYKNPIARYCVLIPIMLIAIGPIALNVFAGKGSGAINEPGGVYIYGPVALISISIAIAIYIYSFIRYGKKVFSKNIDLILFITGAYILTIGIGAYQLVTTGSFEYYFYKSIYLLVIISSITIAVFLAHVLSYIHSVRKRVSIQLFILLTFAGLYVLIQPTYPIVYMNNWFAHTISPIDIQPAIDIKNNKEHIYTDVLYEGDCNNTKDYILNRWTGAIFSSENEKRSRLFVNSLRKDEILHINESYLQKHPKTLVISTRCLD